MIEIMQGFPDQVLAVSAVGTVTDADYKKTLIPAAEDKWRRHERLRVLYHIGPRFEHFEPKAMMDDAAFGLRHARGFERMALVTDVEWCRAAMRWMGFLVPCPSRLYRNSQLSEAENWIRDSTPVGAAP